MTRIQKSLSVEFMYVCVLHVFNVYLSLFSYYMYVCACIVCMCMYLSGCISSKYASQISWEENKSQLFPPSQDKSIFAGWSMYVCVCIACMCVYRMYVHVFFRMHCASQIFLEENMSKVLLCTSHYILIFAG
jgi:hypothetical protein